MARFLRGISAPTDLLNCVLWLESFNGLQLGAQGVATWTDMSGSGNDAIQATAASQPSVSSVNGIPSVKYSANVHYLETVNGSSNGDHTMIGLARWTAAPGGVVRGMCNWGGTGSTSYMGRAIDSNSLFGDPGTSAEGATMATNTVYLMSKVRQAAIDVGQRGRTNLGEDARITTAPSGLSTPKIGIGKHDSAGIALAGDIFAVIMYSRALSFGEIIAAERYLVAKFAQVLAV